MTYLLRNIDPEFWRKVKIKALENDLSVQDVIIKLLNLWVQGKIKPELKGG